MINGIMVMIDKIVSHPASGDSDVTKLLDEREVFACQGKDKRGRRIVRIVGKFFPGN